MKERYTINIAIEKGYEIDRIQYWLNEQIKGSIVSEIRLYNMELIFDGSFDAFLGDVDVFSPKGITKKELVKLFHERPYFIHQITLNDYESKLETIIDETELNRLIANFPKEFSGENNSFRSRCNKRVNKPSGDTAWSGDLR